EIAGMVGAPGDNRLVRVAVKKVHHHFLTDTRYRQHAPALTGPCLSYTNILTRPLVIELLPHRLIPIKNTT
ncbi:hypothetical protein CKY02_23075, partial [Photorhabdus bodei]